MRSLEETTGSNMNTNLCKMKRLAPVLAVAAVGTLAWAGVSCFELGERIQAMERSSGVLERLLETQRLAWVLPRIQRADAADGVQALRLLLCGNIIGLDREAAACDEHTRILVQDAFKRMAPVLLANSEVVVASPGAGFLDQVADAQRIVAQAAGAREGARFTQIR